VSGYEPENSLLRRLATASWPLFRAFGVSVRVHWTTVLVPISTWALVSKWATPRDAAILTAFTTLSLYFVVWTHEMGHIWAGRSVGIETRRITLSPLGGLAHLMSRAPSPESEVWISLAGPMTHAIWFTLAGVPYFLFVRDAAEPGLQLFMLEQFLWTNGSLLAFNLLPCWPMDGGRALRAFLAQRMHPNHASLVTAYAGFAGAVVMILAAVGVILQSPADGLLGSLGGPLLFVIGVTNLFACRELMQEARWGDGPYGEQREPWHASIPQASWSMEDPTPAEPVRVPDRRERRTTAQPQQTARRREAARAAQRPLQERIDELLDKINEVGGIEKLSESERRELSDASEKLRKGDRG
jgi:stage IV sporulation protein FB